MDFQFNNLYGKVFTQCSMDYEAFAQWFNVEVPLNKALLTQVPKAISRLNQQELQEIRFIGREYSLFLSTDDAVVKANFLGDLNAEAEFLEDDFHLYTDESMSTCGLDDFAHLLNAYLTFINEK